MTKNEIRRLITHVSGYKPKNLDNKYITFDFLEYLVENNHITKEECINIKRFYVYENRYSGSNILHFTLVEQLYNKYYKNDTKR